MLNSENGNYNQNPAGAASHDSLVIDHHDLLQPSSPKESPPSSSKQSEPSSPKESEPSPKESKPPAKESEPSSKESEPSPKESAQLAANVLPLKLVNDLDGPPSPSSNAPQTSSVSRVYYMLY